MNELRWILECARYARKTADLDDKTAMWVANGAYELCFADDYDPVEAADEEFSCWSE